MLKQNSILPRFFASSIHTTAIRPAGFFRGFHTLRHSVRFSPPPGLCTSKAFQGLSQRTARSSTIIRNLESTSYSTMASDPEPDAVQVSYPVEGITVITINREKRRNAVNTATANKLYKAFTDYENDPNAKVCVFHGANGTFCAGKPRHISPHALQRSF